MRVMKCLFVRKCAYPGIPDPGRFSNPEIPQLSLAQSRYFGVINIYLFNLLFVLHCSVVVEPYIETIATSLRTSKSALSSSDSLTPKTHRIKQRVASYYATNVSYSPAKTRNCLPCQRPSAPLDPRLTHDWVQPVHLMNADWAPRGRQPSDQANRLGLWVLP